MRRFPWLLLTLFLLSGCAAHSSPDASSQPEALHTEIITLYDPGSQLEAITEGAIRCYPLQGIPCNGLLSVDGSLFLFADSPSNTVVSQLNTENGTITASTELPYPLKSHDRSIQPCGSGFSCLYSDARQIFILNGTRNTVASIDAPEEMLGTPVLSKDEKTLYYCTAQAIRALDLQTGISRVLKEVTCPSQAVCKLILEDTILVCSLSDGESCTTLFLSSETGSTLGISEKTLDIKSCSNYFYASLCEGSTTSLVYGSLDRPTQTLLLPNNITAWHALPESHALLTAQQLPSGKVMLDHYDLHTGLRTASITLKTSTLPYCFASVPSGDIWFLNYDEAYGCDTLYRWMPGLSQMSDTQVYTGLYHTRDTPDGKSLGQCIDFARELGEKYGIEILVYQDASTVQPQDCRLTYEHLAPVLMRELQQLEQNLSSYPQGFLQTIVQRFDGLSICLVREITQLCSHAIVENPPAIQFWDGHHAYIALAAGTDTERGLYHTLCHLIDTIVLNESSAYDTWNLLNPTGFTYDYDYAANRTRNSTAYLLDTNRYFVDMFSMSFPKEDRARVMEYAMTPGNELMFQTDAMQAKLYTLCFGIREAFSLEQCTDAFLWEQYLHVPLAPAV